MPWSLQRFQQAGHLHFITFSCYRRQQLLTPALRSMFERALERSRVKYAFLVFGYVVMPDHVHLLISEVENDSLASAIQFMRQSVARKVRKGLFWQQRYYDFNIFSQRKFVEKLCYMHRNPVRRGLVSSPEDWDWSSFRHYLKGTRGTVEIESEWTARERRGIRPQLRLRPTPPA
jgi:putative transposase